MAVRATTLQRLEEQLTCSVCLGTYANPRTLPCLHSFCQNCIEHLPETQDRGKQVIHCPSCRKKTELPDSGVKGFPSDFRINNLLELTRSAAPQSPEREEPSSCQHHGGRPLEIFCDTCDLLICHQCTFKEHRDHEYDSVTVRYPSHKREIHTKLQQLQDLHGTTRVLDILDQQKERVTQCALTVRDEINTTLQQLHSNLDASGEELKRTLDRRLHEALATIDIQRVRAAAVTAEVASCQEEVGWHLHTGSPEQLLLRKQQLISRMTQSIASLCEMKSYQLPEIDFLFKQDKEVTQRCQKIGEVRLYPLPTSFKASGKGMRSAMVDHKTSFQLIPITTSGDPTTSYGDLFPADSISCYLSDGSQQSSCTVTKVEAGHYKITYTPVNRGPHQLRVLVEDTDIPGSPFTVQVLPSPEMRGTPNQTIALTNPPYDVALGKQGKIAIDQRGDIITVYDNTGERRHSFHYKRPKLNHRGIAFADKDSIAVIGEYGTKVVKLSLDGKELASVNHSAFRKLCCIAVHPSGRVFVTDLEASCIHTLNADFTYSHSFGNKDDDPSQLKEPFSIALDSKGMVYVADLGSSSIHIFSPEGAYISVFPCSSITGIIRWSYLCIDSNDIVYVTVVKLPLHCCMAMYDTRGTLLHESRTGRTGFFLNPFQSVPLYCGIAVDECGNLYVCDYNNHCVLMF